MKRLKWIIGGLLLTVVPMLALVQVASAQRFAHTVDEGETVHSSVYSSGRDINIQGEIFGDVFCFGQSIKIDAKVHGDVICAGMDITVNGTVDGDIRVAGQVVNVGAQIAKNASVAAATFSLDAGAKVGQDLTATGGLNIKGEVGRDAVVSGDNVILNGKIGRNVAVKGTNTTLKNDAEIGGNLNYTATSAPKRDGGAVVKGETTQTKAKTEKRTYFNPILYLMALIGMVFIVIALAAAFPRYLERTSDRLKTKPTRTLLLGGMASIALPAISLGFALTIVGVPVTIFLLVCFLFAAILSGPITAYWIGRLVATKTEAPWIRALVGGAILVTLYFIPFVGFVFIMAAFWFGFGALIADLYANSQFAAARASKK